MEPNDFESAERLGAPEVHVGDADAAEREVHELWAGQRQVEIELVLERSVLHLEVQVLDAALGGVFGEAPELRGLDLAGTDDEGEAVQTAARVRLARRAPSAGRCES